VYSGVFHRGFQLHSIKSECESKHIGVRVKIGQLISDRIYSGLGGLVDNFTKFEILDFVDFGILGFGKSAS